MRRQPEKAVEREIIKNLKQLGFAVSKTSQPRPSLMTIGVPDLYASHARWRLRFWIEVKAGDNRESLAQLAWHAAERAAGGTVVVAWSWSDVQKAIAEQVTEVPSPSPLFPPRSERSESGGGGVGSGSATLRESPRSRSSALRRVRT